MNPLPSPLPLPGGPHRAFLRAAGLAVVVLLAARAEASAQVLSFELRGGIAYSTALVDDRVASGELLDSLLGRTANPERAVGPVTLRPAAAPVVVLAAVAPVSADLSVEAEAGWTFARLRAEDGMRNWDVHDLGIGHAVLGLRVRARETSYVRGGLGLIRYSAESEGVFGDGADHSAVAQLGVGISRGFDRFRVSVDLSGQGHRFGTAPFREIGGQDGTVYRGMLQVGVAFSGGTP